MIYALSHEKQKLNPPSGVVVVVVTEEEHSEASSTFSTPSITWESPFHPLSFPANYLALDICGDVGKVCTLSKLVTVCHESKHRTAVHK